MFHLANAQGTVTRSVMVYDMEKPDEVDVGKILHWKEGLFVVYRVIHDEEEGIDLFLRKHHKTELN